MSRIQSVDCFRVFAILAVIAIHTVPFGYGKPVGHQLDLVLILNQMARFAVPFFLIISGYFWSVKTTLTPDILDFSKKSARRVGGLFILWSLIYLAIATARSFTNGGLKSLSNDFLFTIASVMHSPITSLLQGGKPHLWFLTALLISILISAAFIAKGYPRLLFSLAVALYIVGLLGGPYKESPLGINVNFDFRNGPFLGLICFVSGYLLHHLEPKRTWMFFGVTLTILAIAGQFAELTLLHSTWGTTMWQDYVGSTIFLGVGAAMIALSNHPVLHVRNLSAIGPYVLGVYAIHYFFVDLFRNRHGFTNVRWLDEILYVFIVAALSFFGALILSRCKITKRLVA